MLEFLASVPLLHTLSIHVVQSLWTWRSDLESLYQPVTLGKFERMEVIVSLNYELVPRLFDDLILDNLTDLAVVFSWTSESSASRAAAVARAACRYQSLERLLVKVKGCFSDNASKSFSGDTTIDNFEMALLINVSNNLKELELDVAPRFSLTS
ncbi:hypothetical protein ACEPAF_6110 [Sanghuangporus sanghuang]